jgi:hypothetical protein
VTTMRSFTKLCSELRHERGSFVVHAHKEVAKELKRRRPAADLFRVQALSLTNAKWVVDSNAIQA